MKNINRLQAHLWLIGMKQVDLAEKAGLHACQVNAAVKRNVASPRIRSKIADSLGVPEEKLFPHGTKSY
jgi:transcriptional regulator with XRE-family HTH domain